MKYLEASANSLTLIQLLSTIGTILGSWYFEYTPLTICIILLGYFLYSGVGVSMMLHRYWTHKSFEFRSNVLMWICTWFGLMAGRGSIIGWVHVHREHHAFSDTIKDPHAPNINGWRVFFPHLLDYGKNFNPRLVRDILNKTQTNFNKYYMLLILGWVVLLALIDVRLAYFGWIVPVAITQFVLNSFIYFGHSYGYINHKHRDESKNLWPFGILLWGEGWHNNHHKNPQKWSMQEKWWEIDLIAPLIKLIKK
jgi:stearoyl-CoA desaturase (delta-9 desaturase)